MNLISMVLFTAQTRYWYTLVPALIGNWELYPGFKVRLYVAKDAMAHPISPLLSKITEKLPARFEFHVVEQPYMNCEPTLWRLRPLWEDNIDIMLCRDIDSVPSTEEIQAVRVFLNVKDFAVHSIRSYHLHTTLLMAGLCGFRVPMLRLGQSNVPTFDLFQNAFHTATANKNYDWGCDQEALGVLFGGMRQAILDCPIGNCPPHPPGVGIPTVLKEETYAVPVNDLNADLLAICNEITAIPWGDFKGFAGRPQGDFRPYLDRMLALPIETGAAVKAVLEQNPEIQTFYKP